MNITLNTDEISKLNAHFVAVKVNFMNEVYDLKMGRCNFSLVARYSLRPTGYSLIVVKSLVTRCKICSLLVA